MTDKKGVSMNGTRQTLVDMYHPMFKQGYQHGRQHYFREQIIFTDKHLVECLQFLFEKSEQKEAQMREEDFYFSIGQLVGQMSGCVIARQPHEDCTPDLQDAFLVKVAQEYGAEGPILTEAIRQFWKGQDQLAQKLDAYTFDQMINRGVEKVPLA